MASPCGPSKLALSTVPSEQSEAVTPATVVTCPSETEMRRIRLLPESAQRSEPEGSTMSSTGYLKRASAPAPSAKPPCPQRPARVVTQGEGQP